MSSEESSERRCFLSQDRQCNSGCRAYVDDVVAGEPYCSLLDMVEQLSINVERIADCVEQTSSLPVPRVM
jgi:hypothetical protein